jgi:hypothetical protein
MFDWFFHKTVTGTNFFGIRLNKFKFFTLLSASLYEVDIYKPSKKVKPKVKLFFDVLCLPDSKTRYQTMRRN